MVLKEIDDAIELANSKQNKLTGGLLNEKAELQVLLDDEKAGCGEPKRKLANVKANYESVVHRLDDARQELELVRAILERTQEELGVDDHSYFERLVREVNDPPPLECHEPEEEEAEEEQVLDELEERSEAHSEEEQQVNQQENERRKRALMLEPERCRTRKVELEHAISSTRSLRFPIANWRRSRGECPT
ncbi:hypothetical protein Q1695_011539 [Nippostrongylus brasiliensis]|nr:hypothetical protein Q1695_011539 [Nippostrongylus brasiliensis]